MPNVDGCGLTDSPKAPLFRTIARGTGKPSDTLLLRENTYQMVRAARSQSRDRDGDR